MNPNAEILTAIRNMNNAKFASFTYRAKSTNELARFTVILGFSYLNAVKDSLVELEITRPTLTEAIDIQACDELIASYNETLAKSEIGEKNSGYTKKDIYVNLFKGVSLNINDNGIQIFGLVHSKTVIEEGVYKTVKSSALTIAKNKLRKLGKVSKVREFALEEGTFQSVKMNGEEIVFA